MLHNYRQTPCEGQRQLQALGYSLGVVHLASISPGFLPESVSPSDTHSVLVRIESKVTGDDSVEVHSDSITRAKCTGKSKKETLAARVRAHMHVHACMHAHTQHPYFSAVSVPAIQIQTHRPSRPLTAPPSSKGGTTWPPHARDSEVGWARTAV